MLTQILEPLSDERDTTWNIGSTMGTSDTATIWRKPQSGRSNLRSLSRSREHVHIIEHEVDTDIDTDSDSGDPEISSIADFDMFEFSDFDMGGFSGDEPGIAEMVLAEEESDMMNLDTSHAPIIGGMEEEDLLHYEGATGVDHKSAEDSVGMYLHEIGRVSLLSATEEIALAISMQKGKRAQERLYEAAGTLSFEESAKLRSEEARGRASRRRLIEANLRLVV